MDVFLMVRRHKTTIFLDAKETTTVLELKKKIAGITQRAPEDQKLQYDNQELNDSATLYSCNLTAQTARAQSPAVIGLMFRDEQTGTFEPLEITPFSQPPELPAVMKPLENAKGAMDQ